MFAILGSLVVAGSVIAGFMMEKGNPYVLIQPAELVIIFGAAIGSFLIASPPRVITAVIKKFSSILNSKSPDKKQYLELLLLLYQLYSKIRKEGLISIESDIEQPDNSPIFNKNKKVLTYRHLINFICDNLKIIITTNVIPHELESLMELETETYYHNAMQPSRSIAKVADALPGLGIVAAVLGVVLTMGKIDEPPSVLGHSIGAALVGTFLGVLMCYGFVGPLATNLEHQTKDDVVSFKVIKVALVAFVGGSPPQMAVEFGRRAIPGKERPTFEELENEIRGNMK
jgi:chemotaxis protein MotA